MLFFQGDYLKKVNIYQNIGDLKGGDAINNICTKEMNFQSCMSPGKLLYKLTMYSGYF